MPYKIVMSDGKHCVVKAADGKRMGCHATHEAAETQMQALYANEAMSTTTLWIDPFQYVEGQPFRVFPIGSFKRGDRVIDLTESRLREMERNYNEKRPRWEIPIYFGHPTDNQPDPPKGGNVKRLEFRPGDGLYAHPEYTETAQKSVGNGEYQYISPGVLWSLGGSLYTDEDGNEFDNVIDHIALTNRPFFGNRTAIFSSEEEIMKENDTFAQFKEWFADLFREYSRELRKEYASKGIAMPDGSYPIPDKGALQDAIQAFGRSGNPVATKRHIIKRARALGATDMLPDDWKENMSEHGMEDEDDVVVKMKTKHKEDMKKGETHMADNPKVEEFDAKTEVEKLTAQVKQQADEFAVKLTEANKKADEYAAQLASERKTRRLNDLKRAAEAFVALPIKPDEYAEKFYMLEEKDPELAKWFSEKFALLETQMATGGLFSQLSREDAQKAQTENIETVTNKILAEEFGGDKSKYSRAFVEAGKRRPDLIPDDLKDRAERPQRVRV